MANLHTIVGPSDIYTSSCFKVRPSWEKRSLRLRARGLVLGRGPTVQSQPHVETEMGVAFREEAGCAHRGGGDTGIGQITQQGGLLGGSYF